MNDMKTEKHRVSDILGTHGYWILALILIAAGLFSYFQDYRPFAPDDLFGLSFGRIENPLSFFTGKWSQFLPAYRPISMVSLWVQYQLVGVEPISYFLFNIFVWFGCILVLYFLVYHFTHSQLSSFIAAFFMMVDIRTTTLLVWIIERQNPLVVLFGSLGLLLFIKSTQKGVNRVLISSIFVYIFLLLSALSKEFGLTFTGAIVVFSILRNMESLKRSIIIALLVGITYFGLRFIIAGNSPNLEYCEEIGFLGQAQEICYEDLETAERLKHYIWNTGATFLGTFAPKLFSDVGSWVGLNLDPDVNLNHGLYTSFPGLVFSLVLLCVISYSFINHPRLALVFLFVIAFNSLLNFPIYRDRNQLVGLFGLYVLFGLGFQEIGSLVFWKQRTTLVMIAWIALLYLGGYKAMHLAHTVKQYTYFYNHTDPCEVITFPPYTEIVDIEIVEQLKVKYGMDNPRCLE